VSEITNKLQELLHQAVFVNTVGQSFAVKGILKYVTNDFIIVENTIIPIASIANIRLAREKVS
jgi:hypothetical protein